MKKLGIYIGIVSRRIKAIILLFSFMLCAFYSLSQDPRIKYNFNSVWKVTTGDRPEAQSEHVDDSSWKTVTLPYAWNEEEAFRKDIHDLSTGIAWYRKHFKLPSSYKDKKV